MSKWKEFFTRLLKPGNMKEEVRTQLNSEGIKFLKENFWVSANYKNFKAPGKRFFRKQENVIGSLGISSKRIVAFGFSKMLIHTTFEDSSIKKINFTSTEKYLSAAFDASDFNPKHSGDIEFRFYLSDPNKPLGIIKSLMRTWTK